jgi:hypothetical protein
MYFQEIWVFFKNLYRKFKINENLTNIIGTLCEHLCTLIIVSHWIFLEWEILQTKVVDKTKTQIFFSLISSKNCAIYEIMWNNKVQLDRPQLTICMAHAPCMLDKYKQTCRIVLIAFLQQPWLYKNASKLYVLCLSCYIPILRYKHLTFHTYFQHWKTEYYTKKEAEYYTRQWPLQLVSTC